MSYYQANKERIRKYYQENKEYIKNCMKIRNESRKEEMKEYNANYWITNKAKILLKRKYKSEKYKIIRKQTNNNLNECNNMNTMCYF